jgi:hypothetical protein
VNYEFKHWEISMIKHVAGYGICVLLILWLGWKTYHSQQEIAAAQQELTAKTAAAPKLFGAGASGTNFIIQLNEKHLKNAQPGDHELADRPADHYADDLSVVSKIIWQADIDFTIVFSGADKGLCENGDSLPSSNHSVTCDLNPNLLSGATKRVFNYQIQDLKSHVGPRTIKPCDGCLVELDQ